MKPASGSPLLFKRATLDDALRLVQSLDRSVGPEVTGYPDEGTRFFALRMLERNPDARDDFVMYHVVERVTGRRIGHIGFHGDPDKRGHVRIGYAIALGARGHGYATEAVAWLVNWSEAHGDVVVLEADTEESNHASRRVLEANGFRLVKVERGSRFYERALGTAR